jgi:hypothetical protein
MRYLLAPVVLVALLFAAPAYAETIVMECQKAHEHDDTLLKYENPLIGKAKIFVRRDGIWTQVASPAIGERSAVVKNTVEMKLTEDFSPWNQKAGFTFQEHTKWVYDFDFFKYKYTYYQTKMDGSPLVPGKMGHDRAEPEIRELLCKKPDESWLDRRKR